MSLELLGPTPDSRVVHMYGFADSGKTSIALGLVAAASRRGQSVLYVDWTACLTPEFMRFHGIAPDSPWVAVAMPTTQAEGLKLAHTMMVGTDAGSLVDLIVLDGVGASGDLHGEGLRDLWEEHLAALAASGVFVLVLQSLRQGLGPPPAPDPNSPWGRHCHSRIYVERVFDTDLVQFTRWTGSDEPLTGRFHIRTPYPRGLGPQLEGNRP